MKFTDRLNILKSFYIYIINYNMLFIQIYNVINKPVYLQYYIYINTILKYCKKGVY